MRKKYGPRGGIKATADRKIEDTEPLTGKRMETVDEEFLAAAKDFIDRAHMAEKPFFVWFNPSRMHSYTHLKPESQGGTGLGIYADGMVENERLGQNDHGAPDYLQISFSSTDIAPTIAACLGVKPPSGSVGTVLTEVLP